MTPKEKAQELVKKMYAVHSSSASDITLYFAKCCALVAVDEMIEELIVTDFANRFPYWQEVKQEIEKL
jgi:hypothetical protein